VPGTTRRFMTWPTIGRDVWLNTARSTPDSNTIDKKFKTDASKLAISSPVAGRWTAGSLTSTDHVVAGAADGHVYSIDLQKLDPNKRISNYNSVTSYGQPKWMFPDSKHQLGAV